MLGFGALELSSMSELAAAAAAPFGLAGATAPSLPVPPMARSHRRRQHRASAFLRALARQRQSRRGALFLGLTDRDLYAPHMSFVYGKADPQGGVAVVSLARLMPAAEPGGSLLRRRLLKEALHELGHLAGLAHCADPACVMRFVSGIAGVDFKGLSLCGACAASVRGSEEGSGVVQEKRELYLSSGWKGTPVAAMLASPPSSRSTRA